MAKVTIYTTRFCPYCVRAKQLLSSKGVDFEEIPVDGRNDLRSDLLARTGQRTFPQIWLCDTHVGGFDELMNLERRAQLDVMLAS